mmetsp:Transcript_103163/g.154624  ORF Transcript_103163/g.154624 Transcript_103163/m.154624 type:complete len:556 (-) Transcript_103163:577-2244(-)|eukprot:CAMPEP_0117022044 /NCGR_PEP_ID=MMETSP0472-20121206/16610_1 /TAXON_ID=693140 ORGANISM="Tiarina fusus, Strain LIS" /NCGR_SAMPLE_ID=MMETSP0472 /ASSEMBLY_ACC=CAM_ASM_000603 /LENGTH=555 /DNA_ID=CAMNT_0004727791 /DNA_START=158 /DNA_END=1825 /DNA_ORIENTATION=+
MKFTGRPTVWILLLAQTTDAFQPSGLLSALPKPSRLNAAEDDLPDIVKAYKKAQPPPSPPSVTLEIPPSDPAPIVGSTTTNIPPPVVESVAPTAPTIPDIPTTPATNSLFPDMSSSTPESATKPMMVYVDEFIKQAQANYASRASSVVDSPRDPGSVPTLADFFKGGIQKSTMTETMSVPDSKVPTLIDYLRSAPNLGAQEGVPTMRDNMDTASANLQLLVQNIYNLFTQQQGVDLDFDTSGLPEELSEKYVVGWGIAITALIFAAGARRSGESDAKMALAEASEAGGILASKELESVLFVLQEEVKSIKLETADLRKKLEEAQRELLEKELALSKERLKTADKELQLNREIQRLQTQLQQNDTSAKLMTATVNEAVAVRTDMAAAVAKAENLEKKAKTMEAKISDTVAAPKAKKSASKAKASTAKKTVAKKATTAKKTIAKKKATKGSAKGQVKKVRITKGKAKAKAAESVPESIPETQASTKAKKADEVKKAKKAKIVEKEETTDWSAFSASTLQRKTIKELQEYLDAKGIITSAGDGKPLKKALLVEAVQAL